MECLKDGRYIEEPGRSGISIPSESQTYDLNKERSIAAIRTGDWKPEQEFRALQRAMIKEPEQLTGNKNGMRTDPSIESCSWDMESSVDETVGIAI